MNMKPSYVGTTLQEQLFPGKGWLDMQKPAQSKVQGGVGSGGPRASARAGPAATEHALDDLVH